jgi:hypothetical protein
MRAQIHNAQAAAPKGGLLPPARNKIRDSQSFTLTTLADGHIMPSVFAGTPSASIKVARLMDRLSNVTSRCNVAVTHPARRAASHQSRVTNHLDTAAFLLDTPVEKEIESSPEKSRRSRKTSRYTFEMFGKEVFRQKSAEQISFTGSVALLLCGQHIPPPERQARLGGFGDGGERQRRLLGACGPAAGFADGGVGEAVQRTGAEEA